MIMRRVITMRHRRDGLNEQFAWKGHRTLSSLKPSCFKTEHAAFSNPDDHRLISQRDAGYFLSMQRVLLKQISCINVLFLLRDVKYTNKLYFFVVFIFPVYFEWLCYNVSQIRTCYKRPKAWRSEITIFISLLCNLAL